MRETKTFRTQLKLGPRTYTIETTAVTPHAGFSRIKLLEDIIRNGTQEQITLTQTKEVQKILANYWHDKNVTDTLRK